MALRAETKERMRQRSLRRVYRYLFPWLPTDVNANILYRENEETRNRRTMQRVCMQLVGCLGWGMGIWR
jgi:hypothetical protein